MEKVHRVKPGKLHAMQILDNGGGSKQGGFDLIPSKKVVYCLDVVARRTCRQNKIEDNRILQLNFWELMQQEENARVASGEGGQVSLLINGGKPLFHL